MHQKPFGGWAWLGPAGVELTATGLSGWTSVRWIEGGRGRTVEDKVKADGMGEGSAKGKREGEGRVRERGP